MKCRKTTGSSSVEFPLVLCVFLFAACFPLADMAVLFLGASTVMESAHVASLRAAREADYHTAKTKATAVATSLANGATSIAPADVQVTYLRVPIDGATSTSFVPPLEQTEIDKSKYIYQIQVTITGRVAPLITLSKDVLGDIQGLTAPLVITTSSAATFEDTNGLTD